MILTKIKLFKKVVDNRIFLGRLSVRKLNSVEESIYLVNLLSLRLFRSIFICMNRSNKIINIEEDKSMIMSVSNKKILLDSYGRLFSWMTGKDNSILIKRESLKNYSLIGRRYVSRVRVSRFTGTTAVKVHAPKTAWYINAEKEFLNERNEIPDGYVGVWQKDDLKNIHPNLIKLLHLKCASNKEIHKWRKLQLTRKFQTCPFDISSPPVQLACLTEKILNLRAHLIKNGMDHQRKMTMSIWLARRQKCMKYLYRTDFELYKYVCKELKIKCVRFSIPDSRDYSRAINPIGIDGDRCKFLIRQKLWKARYRPRPVKQADGQTVRYTRHPIDQPPEDFNLSKKHSVELSSKWPYGLREERIQGTYIKRNPTECGIGYCPVPILF